MAIVPVPYPVIDSECDRRLFDSDLEGAIRANENFAAYYRESIAKKEAELKEISVPGFRYPNPAVNVAGMIAYLKSKIEEDTRTAEYYEANPLPSYDSLSFADKVAAQLDFIAPMPFFGASSEEAEREQRAYTRYVRKVTAEAEIIALWNSL